MPKINQQYIKSMNQKALYQFIQKNEGISRAELAKKANLSKATVSTLVDELIEKEYVIDCGTSVSKATGRRPNRLYVNGEKNKVAVLQFHRNWLSAALISVNCEVIYEVRLPYSNETNYVETAISYFHSELENYAPDQRILGICLVFPAIIDKETDKIVSTVLEGSLPDNALDLVRKGFEGYPVLVLNDTSCFAYAECSYNRMADQYYAFINIGHGLGAVILDHGQIFRSANGMTTQFGHFSVDRHGPKCTCGNHGCIERMVGETYLFERAFNAKCGDLFPSENDATFENLGNLAKAQNKQAIRLIDALAEDLACSVGNLLSLFNPDEVVIGGRGTSLGDVFLEAVKRHLNENGFPLFVSRTNIRYSKLSKASSIIGAEQYYMDHYFSFDGRQNDGLYIG